MKVLLKALVLAAALGALPARADDAPSPAMKQVIQAAYLATVVPDLCPEYATDMVRFVEMMTTLHIQPEDMGLNGKYAPIGTIVQLQFRAYADRDRAKACDDAWKLLGGVGSVRLLVRKP